jgi:hypothetical protein
VIFGCLALLWRAERRRCSKLLNWNALWIGKLTHCGQIIEIGLGFTGQLCSFRLKECGWVGDLGRETK